MARRPPLPKRNARSRLQTVISGAVHERVDLYCAHYGITESKFFETAAIEKLDGSGNAKNVSRQLKELTEQLAIMAEHNHLFVQMWLRNTQLFTKQEQQAARTQTNGAYERFLRQLRTNLTGAGAFLGEYQRQLRESPVEGGSAADPTPTTAVGRGGQRS